VPLPPFRAGYIPLVAEVKLARRPVPDGEPRKWLELEVLQQGAVALPCILTTVVGGQRLIALTRDEAQDLGAVEAALFRDHQAPWVGGWGTAILERDKRPSLVTFLRIRGPDGNVFARVWQRVPGQAPVAELAEEYAGPLGRAPRWMRGLFPPLVDAPVAFEPWEGDVRTWHADPGLPMPDEAQQVPDGASLEDALVAAARSLEARFVGGHTGPALVAWQAGTVVWWCGDDDRAAVSLKALGARLALDDKTLAIGLFGLGEDEGTDPPARLIALAIESRAGERLVWIRRFRVGVGSMATWVDEAGFVRRPGPRMGFFD
jgi:hypothetical protein